MRSLFFIIIILFSGANARDYLRIVGSSTGYPFVATAAEHFGKKTAFKTPVVESTGTGGGLKLLLSGYGNNHPDIAIASRKLHASELKYAQAHGITKLYEITLGLDGIVLAQPRDQKLLSLTQKDLYRALAKYLLVGNKLIRNPYRLWSEIDPALPNRPIMIYGPPPSSGTRAIFVEKTFKPLLVHSKYKNIDSTKLNQFRTDGPYVELGENMNLMIQKIRINPDGIAMIGFNYYAQNRHLIKALAVNGIRPNYRTIASLIYPLTRKFYLYAKPAPVRKEVFNAFISEITSPRAISPGGYLWSKGLVCARSQSRIISIASAS